MCCLAAAALLCAALLLAALLLGLSTSAPPPLPPPGPLNATSGGALRDGSPDYGAYPECGWGEFRLPSSVLPLRYDLRLQVHLEAPYQVSPGTSPPMGNTPAPQTSTAAVKEQHCGERPLTGTIISPAMRPARSWAAMWTGQHMMYRPTLLGT